jgi:hypothetical protein
MVSNNELDSKITCRIFNIKFRNKHIYHITMLWKLDCVLDQVNYNLLRAHLVNKHDLVQFNF